MRVAGWSVLTAVLVGTASPAMAAKSGWNANPEAQEAAWMAQGALHNGWGAYAERLADTALAKDPDCGECLRAKADALMQQGKGAEAAAVIEELKKAFPRRGPYWNDFSSAHYDAGDYDEARKYAKKTLAGSANDYTARRILVHSYLREDDAAGATRMIRAARIEVGSPIAGCLEAEVAADIGNADEARDAAAACTDPAGRAVVLGRLQTEVGPLDAIVQRPGAHHTPSFTRISTAGNYACALEAETGLAMCWGRFGYPHYTEDLNRAGPPRQVGTGEELPELVPQPAVYLADVDVSWSRACGLDFAGGVHCWGYLEPGVERRIDGDFKSLDARGWAVTAVDAAGKVHAWGRVDADALPGTKLKSVSTEVSTRADGAVSEHRKLCGLTDNGSLRCFGFEGGGAGPAPAPDGRFRSVSLGEHRMCVVDPEFHAQCWHWGPKGASAAEPMFAAEGAFESISAGAAQFCAVNAKHALVCLGLDDAPEPPTGTFVDVSAGAGRACALADDGRVHCWGPEARFSSP